MNIGHVNSVIIARTGTLWRVKIYMNTGNVGIANVSYYTKIHA